MKKNSLFLVLIGLSLALSGCGGGGGSSSSGSSGGGSTSTPQSSANVSLSVSGLSSGASVTVQATDSLNSTSENVTASADGSISFANAFQTNTPLGANAKLSFSVATQPSNGEQCVVSPLYTNAAQTNGTWAFSPNVIDVSCSTPVKPNAYPTIGAFSAKVSAKVVASPAVVPVFLSGSANENANLTFLQQLVVSHYWGGLSEYGVGNGTVSNALYPTAPSSLSSGSVSDTQIRNAIISANAWNATLNNNTVLVVFMPSGVIYAPNPAEGEPANADGDHGQLSVNGVNIQFVAIFTSTGSTEVQQIAQYLVDAVTNPGGGGPNMASSTGFVEMSPNPESFVGTVYNGYQNYGSINHLGQEFIELGNACDAAAPAESDLTLPSGSYLFAIWSNATASSDYAAGNYGYCQPPFGEMVDYSTSSDAGYVSATRFGQVFTDQALIVPAGSSTSVTVTAWGSAVANGSTQAWTLTVNPEVFYTSGTSVPVDCTSGTYGYEPGLVSSACSDAPSITVSPSGSQSVSNGNTFKVTVTMPSTAEPGLWSILLSGTDGGSEQPILVTNASTWQ